MSNQNKDAIDLMAETFCDILYCGQCRACYTCPSFGQGKQVDVCEEHIKEWYKEEAALPIKDNVRLEKAIKDSYWEHISPTLADRDVRVTMTYNDLHYISSIINQKSL